MKSKDNKQRLFEIVQKVDNTFKNDNTNTDAVERLKSKEVSYMEVQKSKFLCGFCVFLKNNLCTHKKINAVVSATNGCCNLYYPKNEDIVESKDWTINKK
jgi:aspartate oxidase